MTNLVSSYKKDNLDTTLSPFGTPPTKKKGKNYTFIIVIFLILFLLGFIAYKYKNKNN